MIRKRSEAFEGVVVLTSMEIGHIYEHLDGSMWLLLHTDREHLVYGLTRESHTMMCLLAHRYITIGMIIKFPSHLMSRCTRVT